MHPQPKFRQILQMQVGCPGGLSTHHILFRFPQESHSPKAAFQLASLQPAHLPLALLEGQEEGREGQVLRAEFTRLELLAPWEPYPVSGLAPDLAP